MDLTHPFDETTIYWPTGHGFQLKKGPAGYTDKGYYHAANSFSSPEHCGTHMDAPVHFAQGRDTADVVPLERLMGEAVVVDVSSQALANPDYRAQIGDFLLWERQYGRIPDHSIVLLRTGFGKYWPDRKLYLGTDQLGEQALRKMHFPGLHPDAARWLMRRRSIKAIGLDTAGIDYGQSELFETHRVLFENNVPVFENLANLDYLPSQGLTVVALPMKIRGGSGAPLRIAAIVRKQAD